MIVWFDLSVIPTNATNITATCSLYVTGIVGNSRLHVVDTLEQDWVEGSSANTYQLGSSTWQSRGYVTSNPNSFTAVNGTTWGAADSAWATAGGAPNEAGEDTVEISSGTGYYGWVVTGIVNDMFNAQRLGTSTTGRGLIWRTTVTSVINNYAQFASSENTTTPTPKLVVTYDVPPSATLPQVIYVNED